MRALGVSTELSVEQILQCTPSDYPYSDGCKGGSPALAFTYLKGYFGDVKGVVKDKDYPYTSYSGTAGTCKVDDAKAAIAVRDSYFPLSESEMTSFVQSTGPLSVCVDASTWNTYTGGVMTVCGQTQNHCAQAVGVDADPNSANGYWKVKNSFGTNWGEAGFIRLVYGQNTCGIANAPSYVTVYQVSPL
jgi:cysteine peptidase B